MPISPTPEDRIQAARDQQLFRQGCYQAKIGLYRLRVALEVQKREQASDQQAPPPALPPAS